eukprot:1160639-Pelagomonas_calceolata.AAC.3
MGVGLWATVWPAAPSCWFRWALSHFTVCLSLKDFWFHTKRSLRLAHEGEQQLLSECVSFGTVNSDLWTSTQETFHSSAPSTLQWAPTERCAKVCLYPCGRAQAVSGSSTDSSHDVCVCAPHCFSSAAGGRASVCPQAPSPSSPPCVSIELSELTMLSSRAAEKKQYVGRGDAPTTCSGIGDTSAQKSRESPPPQS